MADLSHLTPEARARLQHWLDRQNAAARVFQRHVAKGLKDLADKKPLSPKTAALALAFARDRIVASERKAEAHDYINARPKDRKAILARVQHLTQYHNRLCDFMPHIDFLTTASLHADTLDVFVIKTSVNDNDMGVATFSFDDSASPGCGAIKIYDTDSQGSHFEPVAAIEPTSANWDVRHLQVPLLDSAHYQAYYWTLDNSVRGRIITRENGQRARIASPTLERS